MNNRTKYLFKNVGILAISNFASKILVFLLVPIYTSVLSTSEVGTYDLIVSTVSLLFPIMTLNVIDAVMRFAMDKSVSVDEVASIGIKFISISFLLALACLGLAKVLGISIISGLELYIIAYFVSFVCNQFIIQFSKGIERIKEMGIAGVIGTIAMISANLVFLLVFRWGIKGFFFANILSQVIPALYLILKVKVWKYIHFPINKVLQKEMLLYSMPLIASVIGWWVNSASDRYVVSFICGISANGILSIAYKIPQIVNTLHGIFTQAWQISAIKEYGSEDTRVFYGKVFLLSCTLMSAACSWLIVLNRILAKILYANEFYNAWKYVPFLVISCGINSASGVLGSILSAKKASKQMAMSAVYGASANVVMNIVFVYLIGIQGATIATVISSFIIFAVRKRAVGSEISIQGYGIVLITWLLLCIQAIFEIYTPFWWAEIIMMGVMLFLNWNGIKQIFTTGKSMIHRRENS